MTITRIAVTGGPGAGKTTLLRRLVEEHGERVLGVPEVATPLFRHLFLEVRSARERRSIQRAIYEVQRNLEDVYAARLAPGQVLVCDRGTPDGGGYWPEGAHDFFAAMNTAEALELARYDAVVFLESAAVAGHAIADNNDTRTEDLATASAIDGRLRAVWSRHGVFHVVPAATSFEHKLAQGLAAVRALLSA